VRAEALMAVTMKVTIFYPEDGGSRFLQNYIPDYTVLHPRKKPSSFVILNQIKIF
jgi:hypothetical protein